MTNLAEFMIIAGADNCPPMLEKYFYDSWKSRMEHYMENGENGRMTLNSFQNGPLIWLTITNVDGFPPDVYAIVNHHKVAKEIWDRVKLLMQGMKLSSQEKECKLYDEFDKFTFVKGETLYQYYWRFAQLINNMNVINMSMREVQVNTKFMNSLPPEWSKFVTDVKLARDLHTTNYDQLYSYLEQHESQLNHQTSPLPQIAYNSPQLSTQPLTEFPQMDLGLAVLVFNPGDDLIACLNKAMAFLIVVASLRSPSTNNQLRTSSNPRNQAIIQDGRVTMQQEGRLGWLSVIIIKVKVTWLGNALNQRGQGMLHGLKKRQYGQAVQITIPNTAAFQTEDLDAYDSDCDDVSNAKAVLMANLSNYGSDVLLEVPHSETSHNDMDNQSIHAMQDFEQTQIVDFSDNEITSDSNIIPYS
ncbi:hypothetical protein Tco_1507499 [Tanacetum coccineum]